MLLISPGRSAPTSRTSHSGYGADDNAIKAPRTRLTAHFHGLLHAFSSPMIVSGTPTSLLKLLALLRICSFAESAAKIASLVVVFPTDPVTAIILGFRRAK